MSISSFLIRFLNSFARTNALSISPKINSLFIETFKSNQQYNDPLNKINNLRWYL